MTTAETEAALTGFLVQWERRAFRIAVIATGDREEAFDIAQDAMLKLVRGYRHRPSSEWPALMQRILQSSIRDWYRRQKVRNRWRQFIGKRSQDDERVDLVDSHPDVSTGQPDRQLESTSAMEVLDMALRELPIRQQQVFLLREWEGLDVKQTATAMGISSGSVKTHYSRAVQTLREKLEGHWP